MGQWAVLIRVLVQLSTLLEIIIRVANEWEQTRKSEEE